MSGASRNRAFDEAAVDFDRLAPYVWTPLAEVTLDRSRPTAGERVLDACCGTGASAIPTADLVGPSGQVDAVDLSRPMIEQLRVRSGGRPVLRPVVHDVSAWPGSDYDLVQSVMGIFFLPDMAAATTRLVQRARIGGRVAFTIWRRGAMVESGRRLAEAVAAVRGERPAPRPAHPIEEIETADRFTPWLTARGVAEVSVTEHSHQVAPEPTPLWLLVLGSGFRGMLHGLTPDQVRSRYLASFEGSAGVDAGFLVATGTRAP